MMETETKTTLQPGPVTGTKRHRRGGGQGGPGPQRGRGGVARLSLRNWRVPARLTALILVPTIVGVLLAGLRVVSSIDSVAAYQRTAAEAEIAGHLRDLSLQMGLERDRAIWFQTTRQQRTALADQRKTVDVATTKVRDDLVKIDSGYGVRAVQDALQVGNRLDTMAVIRKGAQAAKYNDLIASLLRLHDEIIQTSEDPQLIGDARGLSALAHAKEEASQQRGTLIGTLARGDRFTPDKLEEFIASRSRQKAAMTTFNGEAGADNGMLLALTLRGQQMIRAELTKSWAIALASRNLPVREGNVGGGAVKQWFDDSTKTIELLQRVENQVAASVAARASALESTERRNAIIAGVLILALILLVLATTVLIARSLVRPLRRLRSEALEIAGSRLPAVVRRMRETGEVAEAADVQPILVGTQDEIGEVATAFDEVHRQALRLAAEESQLRGNVNAMFVNLSRRIQTLVERQISLIDGLERGEQDGGRLADLFKLDHLATRMRRNSENLLVLAGHEAARKRSQPAKLVDVVRASLSEVEGYERVSVKVHRNSAIAGHAANDVVHLVAELVENALAFSPGNTRVVVSSSMIEGGGALLAVSDAGIGMTAEEIAEVNRRLADPPVVDVSVSRRMGLFVVGRLALRHDIRVQLRRGDSAGLIAMVLFPPQLITVAGGRGPVLPQRGATQDTPTPASGAGRAPNGSGPGGQGGESSSAFNAGSQSNGTGSYPAPNGTGSYPAPNGTGSYPAPNGTGSYPAPNGTGSYPAPNGTGSYPAPNGTGSYPAPNGTGSFPVPNGTGSSPGSAGEGPTTPRPLGAFGGPAPTGPVPGHTGPVPASGAADPSHRSDESSFGPVGPTTGPRTGPFTPSGPRTGPEGPWTGPEGPRTGPEGPRTGPVTPGGAESRLERGDEFLPIFASVESAWFRRPDPGEIAATRGQAPAGPEATGGAPRVERFEGAGQASPAEPVPQAPEPSRPATGGAAWGSTADSGWQAADAVKDPTLGGITSSGLPKRTPKANLVPGSVTGPSAPAAAPSPPPQVSAEQIRARMSRFQQGIQRGRADITETASRNTDTDQLD
ncbi:nitrate- and nitrite sensing domain-containing protein [Sphaerisporangium perillae]|uniref:nitrate- and nitrite sensing domain-containing protein n=1 Tax=Sphaerisporangium perillae TaxID=2935860 RepID=UPI002434BAEE|nr:nitrate- and nitrite sensing domain-containing protein [Sphaerisporangium perillae]